MGNLPSLWDENKISSDPYRNKNQDSVSIKLSCADFGVFDGRSDHWITFKENTLSKAGVGGYAQYFKEDFIETLSNKEGNNRIFYLLQTATNGGEPPMLSVNMPTPWALKLRSKDDVNKHVNDFTLYMDQLKELGREEREETLTDLFLDSIVDPKFEVTVANCRLRDRISIHECFEAIRKYDNVIMREATQGEGNKYKIRRINGNGKQQGIRQQGKVDSSYRTYNEWQKLNPDQRAAILEARERENEKNDPKDDHEPKVERETSTGGSENSNRRRQQRGRKRTRRQAISHDNDRREDEEEIQEEEGPL
jgi:hypothetical protein